MGGSGEEGTPSFCPSFLRVAYCSNAVHVVMFQLLHFTAILKLSRTCNTLVFFMVENGAAKKVLPFEGSRRHQPKETVVGEG